MRFLLFLLIVLLCVSCKADKTPDLESPSHSLKPAYNLPQASSYKPGPVQADSFSWHANTQTIQKDSIPSIGLRYTVALNRNDIIPSVVFNDSLEGEDLEIFFVTGGEIETQYISEWDWSNKAQMWWRNGQPGDTATFIFILPESGKFRVQAHLSQAADYGMVSLLIDRQVVFPRFNGYTAEGVKTVPLELGTMRLGKGKHLFEMVLLGKDPRVQDGYMAGIDLIIFTPTQ